jgi:DNA polymerase-3 subunit gamma/tau
VPQPVARPARGTSGEPDVPLPPEPTDDEDWPHPAQPAAQAAATARTEAAPAAAPAAPRPAAESAPAPRGGEPTPLVSADPQGGEAAGGDLSTADLRRMWPELLAVVKRHKRTTEALLNNAQVHDLSNNVLTLSFASPALTRRMGDDLNKDVLREALNELLGVRWKVEAVVDGGSGGPASAPGRPGAGPAGTPEGTRQAAEAADAAEAREIVAQRAAETSDGVRVDDSPAVDPEQAALSLLRAQLGAHPIDS